MVDELDGASGRELRRALGQFATGVTVVTALAADGRYLGVTANSFAALSLDPPLVLFCLAKRAPSHPELVAAERFAIHVLGAHQYRLSRQFATPAADKFAGVHVRPGPDGVPLIDGVLARFVCRHIDSHDGGDHTILVGEVTDYQRFDGEPLVFHSGGYHVPARHPESSTEPSTDPLE